jgi:threonine aldolase
MIAGSRADMARAVHVRRMFGGALRQAGILAAAGLYALDHNLARLPQDHAHARLIAERLAHVKGVRIDLARVQTNIVIVHLEDRLPEAAPIAARAREKGFLLSVFGRRTLRAVAHLDVTHEDCVRAAETLARILEE